MRAVITISFIVIAFIGIPLKGQDLYFYIKEAKDNSPLIQDNKNQSEAAQLEIERLRAFYTHPQISLSGSYQFSPIISHDNGNTEFVPNPDLADKYSGYDLAATNGGAYQGLLNINQPLFNGARYQSTAQQAIIGAQINENNAQLTAHDLEKLVTDQYILCLQDQAQLDYVKEMIQIISNQKDIVEKLVENGIANQSDLSLLMIEQKTQEAALNTTKATHRRDLMDLRVLCGIPDTTYQVLDKIDLQLSEDIGASHFTEKYRLDSLNLVAAQQTFETKYKPQVGLFANTGLNAVYAPTIPNRFGLSAGINFSMNITDGKQKKISSERTNVLLRSTSLYKDFFYNQNSVRKNRILMELKSIGERITILDEQLTEYNKLLDLYQRELSIGQLSVINYISILKNRSTLQRDLLLLITNKELLINLYNYWNW